MITGEHEFEAQRGLPQRLPVGEHILWQGGPRAAALARDALHLPLLALYFGVLLSWRALSLVESGARATAVAADLLRLIPLALITLGIALCLATLVARTTLYTITNRRVVMRIGVVLTLTLNLPFRQIDAAQWRAGAGGTGDITLALAAGNRIGWIHLWPHVRPWRLSHPQPMLRGLPDVGGVAAILSRGLRSSQALDALPASDLPLARAS